MSLRHRMRRWLPWLVAVGALFVIAAVVGYVVLHGEQGDISHPDVEFHAQPTATTPAKKQPRSASDPGFEWPFYGYDAGRTRYLPLKRQLHPPYRKVWRKREHVLLEFPPALSSKSLYLLKNNAALVAISRRTGKDRWRKDLGQLAASSPAVGKYTVYAVILERGRGIKAGRVIALDGKDGRTRWSRKLPSRAESSPLLYRGLIIFGTENGTVYALRARDGAFRWKYKAQGAVKGGVARDEDGHLFFGDYAGHVHSLRARDGKSLWNVTTKGAKLGLSSGRFYSTAAAAYGRVFIGNTDGFVYSFAQSSGKLAWRTRTGGYVYGSPAVAQVKGSSRPLVYIGSYDRKFYALDAKSGKKVWVRNAHGRVSGGATLIGDVVWYSTLEKHTYAIGARTGRDLWRTPKGQFNPAVSDGNRIYLIGSTTLTAIVPRSEKAPVAKPKPKPKAKPKKHKAKPKQRKGRTFHQPKSAVVCFKAHGKTRCRHRKPAVCYQAHGHLTCTAQRRRQHKGRR